MKSKKLESEARRISLNLVKDVLENIGIEPGSSCQQKMCFSYVECYA